MTMSSGGTTSGMKAMWTGMRFWLMIAMTVRPPSTSMVVMRMALREADSSSVSILAMSQFASSWGRPECATAMAKAPSSA